MAFEVTDGKSDSDAFMLDIEIKVSLFTSEIKSIESSFLIESLALNDLEHKRLVNT